MTQYRFPADAGATLPDDALTIGAIAAHLDRLGLHKVQLAVQGRQITVQGQVPDTEAEARIILALGNLRGIATVKDAMVPTVRSGLLGGLGAFAHLPPGAATTDAAQQAVHAASPEPGSAYGPDGSLFHRVLPGETLESIALRHYGDAAAAGRIMRANSGLPMMLPPGWVVRLPH